MSNIIGRAAEELLQQEEENLNNTIVVTTDIISISTGLVHYTTQHIRPSDKQIFTYLILLSSVIP